MEPGIVKSFVGLAICIVLAASCSTGSKAGSSGDAGIDSAQEVAEADVPVLFEAHEQDLQDLRVEDGGAIDGTDLGNDAWQPQPCQTHDDCQGGFCVEFPPAAGTFYCAETCIEECPAGLVCKSIFIDGPDPVSVCLPAQDLTCAVCKETADCLYAGTLCIKGANGYGYCALVCEPGGLCPDGTECGKAALPDGGDGDFCLPAPSSCCVKGKLASCDDGNPCTQEGCDPALGCTHLPTDGECTGEDPCSEYWCIEGKCTGTPVVADLKLDGIDEDCDGLTDEDAYKGFRLVGTTVVSAPDGEPAQGAGLRLRSIAGPSAWSGTSAGEGISLAPGTLSVTGAAK